MARKRYKPEEIVAKLRQVDVLTSQGMPVADVSIGIQSGPLIGAQKGPLWRDDSWPEAA